MTQSLARLRWTNLDLHYHLYIPVVWNYLAPVPRPPEYLATEVTTVLLDLKVKTVSLIPIVHLVEKD